MTKASKTQWISPKMDRIGTIGDVAATNKNGNKQTAGNGSTKLDKS